MTTRPTLRGRVSLLALAVIGAWVVLVALVFDVVAMDRLAGQLDDKLRIRAQAASALATIAGGRVTGVRESATDAQLDAGTWIFGGDRAVDHPLGSTRLQRVVERVRKHPGLQTADGHRFYVLPVRSGGHVAGTVITEARIDSLDDTRATIVFGSIAVALLILVGAYPVVRFTAGRALRPVARMAGQAAEWSSSSAQQRFGAGEQYQELHELARSLDGLLDRIDAVLRHERRLSGELSHELRTPLTRMLGEIELLLDQRPDGDDRDALTALRDSCLTMNVIIDSALAATRAELVTQAARTPVDDVLATYADTGPPVIEASPSTAVVGVEAAVVERILNALVDNARRHARSRVRLRTAEVDGSVEISVEDDGAGVPLDDTEIVFEPGYSRTSGDHSGAGLGLPLARRLARAADGDLEVDPASPGARFVLRLPRG